MSRPRLRPPLPLIATLFLIASSAYADGPPRLKALEQGPVAYHSVDGASAMDLWQTLADSFDFKVVFDPLLKDVNVDLEVGGTNLGQTLDRLALAAGHFWTALDDHTVVVAHDTPQMRRAYEPQVVRTFRLENAPIKNAMTGLRSIFGLKHLVADETRQTLTVRDTAHRVALTESLLEQIDRPADEVAIQVELVAVDPKHRQELKGGPDSVREILQAQRAEALLNSDLNVVGHRTAALNTRERDAVNGDLLSLSLELEATVHAQSREVTLTLESESSQSKTKGADSEQISNGFSEASSWRMASGDTRLIHLAGSWGASKRKLALLITPTIRRVGSPSEASPALWVGLGSMSSSQSAKPRKASTSEADRDEVRQKLRNRLANLPRGHQSEQASSADLQASEE